MYFPSKTTSFLLRKHNPENAGLVFARAHILLAQVPGQELFDNAPYPKIYKLQEGKPQKRSGGVGKMSLNSCLEMFRETQKRISEAKEKETHILSYLQEEIRKGKSTGHFVTDYVLLNFHGDPEVEKKVQSLYQNLSANLDGLVLLEERYTQAFGQVDSSQLAVLSLGKITAPFLKLGKNGKKNDAQRLEAEIYVDSLVELKGRWELFPESLKLEIKNKPNVKNKTNINLTLFPYLGFTSHNFGGLSFFAEKRIGDVFKTPKDKTTSNISVIDLRTSAQVEAYELYIGTNRVEEFFSPKKIVPLYEGKKNNSSAPENGLQYFVCLKQMLPGI